MVQYAEPTTHCHPFETEDQHRVADPLPWVAWDMRYPRQIGTAYFAPREGYSQRIEDYA